MEVSYCDVAIIGAGTAGIAAERSARALGAKTFLVDDRFAGTTCATVGCMPSKLLIAAADAVRAVSQADLFGIRTGPMSIDGPAVLHRVRAERDRFAAATRQSFEKLPDDVCIQGRAHFMDATTLVVQGVREIKARAIVIATGSEPAVPENFAELRELILTNENVFELRDLPKSVAVIGAGPLGMELAQALVRLRVTVRVFDEAPSLPGIADPTIERHFRAIIGAELPITLGVKVGASRVAEGVLIQWSGAANGSQTFERILLAAGRPPQLEGLNLKSTRIELDERGIPRYDRATLQCSGSSIFIAGDADHERPVLHEAAFEGSTAGRNAATYPHVSAARRYASLSVMFTDPQLAIVGTAPKHEGETTVVGSASFADQGRARMFARNAGLIHVYADNGEGRISGATLCGPAVEHIAHLIAWAVQLNITASELLRLPFYHPTYEEGLKAALRQICELTHSQADDLATPGE
jgi:dihydrolipoamide dehydrogenase